MSLKFHRFFFLFGFYEVWIEIRFQFSRGKFLSRDLTWVSLSSFQFLGVRPLKSTWRGEELFQQDGWNINAWGCPLHARILRFLEKNKSKQAWGNIENDLKIKYNIHLKPKQKKRENLWQLIAFLEKIKFTHLPMLQKFK